MKVKKSGYILTDKSNNVVKIPVKYALKISEFFEKNTPINELVYLYPSEKGFFTIEDNNSTMLKIFIPNGTNGAIFILQQDENAVTFSMTEFNNKLAQFNIEQSDY